MSRLPLFLLALAAFAQQLPTVAGQGGGPGGSNLGRLGPEVLSSLESLRGGRPLAALRAFEKALPRQPDNPRLHMLIAEAHLRLNHCEDGQKWSGPMRTKPAYRLDLPEQLASCSARTGDYSDAVYWQEELLAFDPEGADDWATLALYRYRQGDVAGTESALYEAWELDPDHTRLLITRATIAVSEGQLELADELIAELLERPESGVIARTLEARVLMDLDDPVGAEAVLAKAKKRQIADWNVLALRAEAQRRAGDPETADMTARRNRTAKDRQVIRVVLVRTLSDLGRFDEAAELLTLALEADPYDLEAIASAWYLAQARGEAEDARAWARHYERLRGNNPYRELERLLPLRETP
jgi:tetratricopeptide (TPR) repeat protein